MRRSSGSPEVAVQLAVSADRSQRGQVSDMIEATINDKLVVVGSSLSLARQFAAAAGLPQEVAEAECGVRWH
eukprot:381283-Pyramimonas_sp.AAC.1